jgi:hypothetical protein
MFAQSKGDDDGTSKSKLIPVLGKFKDKYLIDKQIVQLIFQFNHRPDY